MRNSLTRIAISLAVAGGLAALWVIPSSAQMPGTMERPGMSPARVWINNRTREEAIPVTFLGDPRGTPMPVTVLGEVDVDFSDHAIGTLNQIQGRTQPTVSVRQTWEYRDVTVGSNQGLAGSLTALGNDGWEAAGITTQPNGSVTVLLKRPR